MTPRKEAFENILGKGENAAFWENEKMFSTIPKQISIFKAHLLSSARALNLDLSKILSFGKGLMFSEAFFFPVCWNWIL